MTSKLIILGFTPEGGVKGSEFATFTCPPSDAVELTEYTPSNESEENRRKKLSLIFLISPEINTHHHVAAARSAERFSSGNTDFLGVTDAKVGKQIRRYASFARQEREDHEADNHDRKGPDNTVPQE